MGQPSHVRCLREADWKIVEDFYPTGIESSPFELDVLVNDPLKLHNMGNPTNSAYHKPVKWSEMTAKLDR